MLKVRIKQNKLGDTRTATKIPTFSEFVDSNNLHRRDVKELMDAIIIDTPHYLHHTIAMAAVDRGIHVLSDKYLLLRKHFSRMKIRCLDIKLCQQQN